MKAKKLVLENFRNILSATLCFNDGVNIIVGENAQGKTNIIEAIWMMSAGKSFRGIKEKEIINFEKDKSTIMLDYEYSDRDFQLVFNLFDDKTKEIFLNGVKKTKVSEIIGCFFAVLFTPEHLSLIKDGPSERRRFIDTALCQLKPTYLKKLNLYNRIMEQRNSLLKQIRDKGRDKSELEVWDSRLAMEGAKIIRERKLYLKRLEKFATEEHREISNGKEELKLSYLTLSGHADMFVNNLLYDDAFAVENNDTENIDLNENQNSDSLKDLESYLYNRLTKGRERDIREGATTSGPHRDDIEIYINNQNARLYASQGQQRSAVLAMKAGECKIITEETGEKPVMLLDDVLSELDKERQKFILSHFLGGQVIITCCDDRGLRKIDGRCVFKVKNGNVETKKSKGA